jgi:WD domain, G-beta repeat
MLHRTIRRPAHSDNDIPVIGLLIAVLLILLVGGGGFITWQWRRAQMQAREARAQAMEMEARAQEAEEMARVQEEKAKRPKEQAMADLLHPRPPHPAEDVLKKGLALCGKGEINEGFLWFVRGLEQSGDDAALQRVFRANLSAWDEMHGGRKLTAQKGAVTALVLSPDGKRTLTGGDDGTAQVWRSESGQPAGEAMASKGKVTALGFGAGGKEWLIANGPESRRIDAATAKPIDEPVETPGDVLAVTVKADGQVMMFGTCERGTWLAHDGGRDEANKLFTAPSPVLSGALGPDVQVVLTGHEDHQARVWDVRGKPIGNPLPHEAPVAAVAISADGKLFATGAGKTAHLWDAVTHQLIGRPLAHDADVLSLAFAPDGSGLVTGDQAGTVRHWTVPAPLAGDVSRLKLWVEIRAAKELDGAGTVRPLNPAAVMDRRQMLQAAGGPPKP